MNHAAITRAFSASLFNAARILGYKPLGLATVHHTTASYTYSLVFCNSCCGCGVAAAAAAGAVFSKLPVCVYVCKPRVDFYMEPGRPTEALKLSRIRL